MMGSHANTSDFFRITFNREHTMKFRNNLVGAAALLTLVACDGGTLSVNESDLAGDGVNVNVSTNEDGDLVIGLIDDANTNTASSEAGSYQVTFTNMTMGQLMTPPVVAIHDPSVHLFQVGEVASDAIQVIAEMGNNAPLVEFAVANPGVVSAAGVAGEMPFGPGESVSINLTTTEANQVFSAVNMIICTNDGISGIDSFPLPSGNQPLILGARPYDAGTRVNQNNSYSFFPPPCRTRADGTLIDVQEAPLESPRASIAPHAGQFRTVHTPANRNWDFETEDKVLKIEIVRN